MFLRQLYDISKLLNSKRNSGKIIAKTCIDKDIS